MQVIHPPQSLSIHHRRPRLVFLAGSIEMGGAEDWQESVANYFKQLPEYTVLNPRRKDWDSSWQQEFENPQFQQQVNWELNGLERADWILLYLAPGTKSPISLLELGLFANSGKLLACCPNGFWRKGNVEVVAERYGFPVYENLSALLERHFPVASV